MPFSLLYLPGQTDFRYLTVSDGRLNVLDLYQSRAEPSKTQGEKPAQVLSWHGTAFSLSTLWKRYCRIIAALGALDPAHAYNTGAEITIWFGEPVSGLGFGSNMLGKVELKVVGQGKAAIREIKALIRRHEKDWNVIDIGSRDRFVSLNVGSGEGAEISFGLRDTTYGLSKLPLNALADFIESTSPQAVWYEKTGADTVEERFEPWPLSHEGLVEALADIEKRWFASPNTNVAA